ncbi:MAG: glutathione S-transferase family protein [Pseudomonadota bacterium]
MTQTKPYILYGGGNTRSAAPQMVLEEAGLPYELREVDIDNDAHREAGFLAINPAGYVPALATPEGDVLHESNGIMLYLTDRHGLVDLAPGVDDPTRGPFLSKLFFQGHDIQPAMKRTFYPERYVAGAETAEQVRQAAWVMAQDRWKVLDDHLAANGPYHLGERFSFLDLNMALWAAYGFDTTDDVINRFPAIHRCFDLVLDRPKSALFIEHIWGRKKG